MLEQMPPTPTDKEINKQEEKYSDIIKTTCALEDAHQQPLVSKLIVM